MRIVGDIEHPRLKITIFKMDERYSIKFESGLYEQTYKIRSSETINSPEDVKALVDTDWLSDVETILKHMHRSSIQAQQRRLNQNHDRTTFDTII